MARKVNKQTQNKQDNNKSIRSQRGGDRPQSSFETHVYCEGETEEYYFKSLNKAKITNVKIEPGHYTTKDMTNLDKSIGKVLSANAKVYCFFDLDRIYLQNNLKERSDYDKLMGHYADNGNVVFCESLPSFELWLLLHFDDFNSIKHFDDQDDVIVELEKRMPSFKKGKGEWFDTFMKTGHLDSAIWKALRINEKYQGNQDLSYTNAYKFYLDHKAFAEVIRQLIDRIKDKSSNSQIFKFIEEKYKKLLN